MLYATSFASYFLTSTKTYRQRDFDHGMVCFPTASFIYCLLRVLAVHGSCLLRFSVYQAQFLQECWVSKKKDAFRSLHLYQHSFVMTRSSKTLWNCGLGIQCVCTSSFSDACLEHPFSLYLFLSTCKVSILQSCFYLHWLLLVCGSYIETRYHPQVWSTS